jgi:hypothetical protein
VADNNNSYDKIKRLITITVITLSSVHFTFLYYSLSICNFQIFSVAFCSHCLLLLNWVVSLLSGKNSGSYLMESLWDRDKLIPITTDYYKRVSFNLHWVWKSNLGLPLHRDYFCNSTIISEFFQLLLLVI